MSDRWQNNPWTDTAIETLRRLWPDPNMSCAKIAMEIGNGVTRCSVIGKGRRIGLGPKPSDHTKTNTAKRLTPKPKAYKPKPVRNFGGVWGTYPDKAPEPFIPRAADIVSHELDVLELSEDTCKWPSGDPQEGIPFTFCGHTAAPGKPYCQSHCVIAYYKPAKRSPAQKAWDAKLNQRTARRNPDAQAWIAEDAVA